MLVSIGPAFPTHAVIACSASKSLPSSPDLHCFFSQPLQASFLLFHLFLIAAQLIWYWISTVTAGNMDDYYDDGYDDGYGDGYNDDYDDGYNDRSGEIYEEQPGGDGGEPDYDGPVHEHDDSTEVAPEYYDGADKNEGQGNLKVGGAAQEEREPDSTACEEVEVPEEELDTPTQDERIETSVEGSSQGPAWTGNFREGYEVIGPGVNEQGNCWTTRVYGPDAPNQNPYHYSNR